MKIKKSLFIISFFLIPLVLNSNERKSSYPFISGDSFRSYCNFTYDEITRNINPELVKNGDTIFVKTDYLGDFFTTIHNKITSRYILITHNSDFPIPGNYAHKLNDPKLIAWFGQNVENYLHPKLHPIPIGVANSYWPHGNIKTLTNASQFIHQQSRDIFLYLNINLKTNPSKRVIVFDTFINEPFCFHSSPKPFSKYLEDLTKSIFVVSPRGNGLDCHRTWEALLMGAIPIVISSSLDPMFEDLPVLIVNDWNEITLPMLEAKYLEFQTTTFNNEKKYLDYWLKLIDSFK